MKKKVKLDAQGVIDEFTEINNRLDVIEDTLFEDYTQPTEGVSVEACCTVDDKAQYKLWNFLNDHMGCGSTKHQSIRFEITHCVLGSTLAVICNNCKVSKEIVSSEDW